MELAIILWVICGAGAGVVASNRGESGCAWFAMGVLLGPIGFALAFTTGSHCPACQKRISTKAQTCPFCQHALAIVKSSKPQNDTKKCPDCAEIIKAEARKCRFCGCVQPEITAATQSAKELATVVPTEIAGPVMPTAPAHTPKLFDGPFVVGIVGAIAGIIIMVQVAVNKQNDKIDLSKKPAAEDVRPLVWKAMKASILAENTKSIMPSLENTEFTATGDDSYKSAGIVTMVKRGRKIERRMECTISKVDGEWKSLGCAESTSELVK